MTTNEIITVAALLAGPILAVVVQISAEHRKQLKDAQTTTFRMLVGTRHLPSDPAYSTAINMIPIDFNRVANVMAAYSAYIKEISFVPNDENRNLQSERILTNQTKLIFAIAQHLRYDIPETDIQTTAYAAGGFIARDNLMIDGWRAWQRIADALEAQTRALFSDETNKTGGDD